MVLQLSGTFCLNTFKNWKAEKKSSCNYFIFIASKVD